MNSFFECWSQAALTTVGFFWMALWAFCLGYLISSMIQVFVTRRRIKQLMGESGLKSVILGTFFGFISSSCSFAALSTSRAIFQKGAGLVPALAFLLASTNLVIELGILIFVFLSWQFVVGEYVGGLILIAVMWLVVRLTLPKKLEEQAREHARQASSDASEDEIPDWKELIGSLAGWRKVGRQYWMEWGMVWKDVTFGFTIAGIIAAFVPPEFFQTLFVGSGSEAGPTAWEIVLHTLIGPLAAFFTFIGSMGNIPLAAILFGSGVSFAGVMAFIFSDLVVFPVLRISARYFGWKMAAYILGVFLVCLVTASLILQLAFGWLNLLPDASAMNTTLTQPLERFKFDYTMYLNAIFALMSLVFFALTKSRGDESDDHQGHDHGGHDSRTWTQWTLLMLATASFLWLAAGIIMSLVF